MYKLITFDGVVLPDCHPVGPRGLAIGSVPIEGKTTLDGSFYYAHDKSIERRRSITRTEHVRVIFPQKASSGRPIGAGETPTVGELDAYQSKVQEVEGLFGRTGQLVRALPDGTTHSILATLSHYPQPTLLGHQNYGQEITIGFDLIEPFWTGQFYQLVALPMTPGTLDSRAQAIVDAKGIDTVEPGTETLVVENGPIVVTNNGNATAYYFNVKVAPTGAGGYMTATWIYNDTTGHGVYWASDGRNVATNEYFMIQPATWLASIHQDTHVFLSGQWQNTEMAIANHHWLMLKPGDNELTVNAITVNTPDPYAVVSVEWWDIFK